MPMLKMEWKDIVSGQWSLGNRLVVILDWEGSLETERQIPTEDEDLDAMI